MMYKTCCLKSFLIIGLCLSFIIGQAQRNVIHIIADDISSDYFGFYENHQDTVNMPNIRKLLNKGIVFNNAWSNPLCSPTRAGMLTGRYSFRTGIGNAVGNGAPTLDTSEVTIPRLLKIYTPSGIATANIGKWHLNDPMPKSNFLIPIKMGYDHYEGNFLGQIPSYTNWSKVKDGENTTITTYATTETTNNAIDWIKAVKAKPFFLWLAYNAPHTPHHLPPAGLHSYNNLSGTSADIAANPKNYFKASVEALDTEIGRLFDSLEVYGQWDNTDIIFIGDNGNDMTVAQNQGGAKGTIYQEGISVPFIISGPSVANPGRYSDALVNIQDVFSTTLELFGYMDWATKIPADRPVDSKSLLPIINAEKADVRDWAFTEVFKIPATGNDGKTMRNKAYKLLNFDNGNQRFYKIDTDPTENNNLLTASLSNEAAENYDYLCSEMVKLLGTSGPCISAINADQKEDIDVYPNPFTDYIHIENVSPKSNSTLFNQSGEIVYRGRDIEKQNFSYLLNGVYYLQISDHRDGYKKLLKVGNK